MKYLILSTKTSLRFFKKTVYYISIKAPINFGAFLFQFYSSLIIAYQKWDIDNLKLSLRLFDLVNEQYIKICIIFVIHWIGLL